MRAPKYSSAAATGVKLKGSAKKRRCTATAMATNRYASMFTSKRVPLDSVREARVRQEVFACRDKMFAEEENPMAAQTGAPGFPLSATSRCSYLAAARQDRD